MATLLILATALFSFYCFQNPMFIEKYSFKPYRIHRYGEYYRFITHGFVHADFSHLIFNMLTLYFVKDATETIFSPFFIVFYFLALIASSLPDYFMNKNNPYYDAIGASGAVAASLFALVLFDPWGMVYIYFIIPVYFILLAVFYLGYSYYMGKQGRDHIGHYAHLSGAIFGIIATILYRPESIQIFIQSLLQPPFLR
jgi:membrane associated rhomboid family serine protease